METKRLYTLVKGRFFKEINPENVLRIHRAFPHYNFEIKIEDSIYEVNINVYNRVKGHPELRVLATSDPDSDLINIKPLEKALALPDGVYNNPDKELVLDYLRGNYFDLNRFQVPFKPAGEQEEDYLLQLLKQHVELAQKNDYSFCIWGKSYTDNQGSIIRNGIHDIHMNQGSEMAYQNSIWQDGALVITDAKEIKFACFLGFITQCLITDDKGDCSKD
ncbi:DUF2278 family protein [Flavobacterium sp. WV_118_3]|uniref:DUF2278 family protein n=1 Tax=Flavobacterium sp. WV_118_3 TaxID=3151764 RepID=UPI00321A2ACE